MKILNLFTRVIAAGRYRPEIDGLRFIAVFSVLLFHIDGFLLKFTEESSVFSPLFSRGDLGVPLFFSISGFVLMGQIIKAKNFSYSKYISRRMERIEPPFLITTLIFYLALSFRDGFSQEMNYSLFRVLTYTSNFSENLINVVTWSLEIEVVFYLLLPLMFMIMKSDLKKWGGLTIIVFIFSQFFPFAFMTSYFHWFVIGISLAIIEKDIELQKIPSALFLTFASLLGFFLIGFYVESIIIKVIEPVFLFMFLYGVIIKKHFVKILSFKLFTIIGGACYIIYLIHFQVVSILGHKLIPYINNREVLWGILLVTVLVICLMAFPVLERPFMKRNWWRISKKRAIDA